MSIIRLTDNLILISLTTVYLFVLIFSAIDPHSWDIWIAEILPVLFILIGIWFASSHYTFSKTAYFLMFIWIIMHSIGAKYTFAEVPFDWFNTLIQSPRNNYDRVAHFSIGFYAYPIAEYLIAKSKYPIKFAQCFALFTIMSVASGYEIIEWWYADIAGGEAGIAFLGSQGDMWDAQKDMLCDTLGAITVLLLLTLQLARNPLRFKIDNDLNEPNH
ncbi:hypothetical protein BCU68_15800 [Vibrio sp. 10N.286.49.B3]|uniref:DUF2238 domain-containing protein n=1 Tax=Vibrio sp. 10N.286.49.B3 TaxID=1880855 RepID=UPI000C8589D0|nr:DUF2238 domain-containing protein [Vibrio sp. 10N.286.49.B3]PMH41418.1 hypothetical protein BCU68_15800 [Vibrio sp. 10N.286.49.B3]